MTMSRGLGEATIWAKVAFLLILVCNILNFIAFSTTSWGISHVSGDDDYHTGLWRRCRSTTAGCDYLDGYAKIWFGVVQGFACVGFAGVNVTFVLIICYLYVQRCIRDREVSISAGFIAIFTSVCWLIAIITFGAEYEYDSDVSPTTDPYGDDLGYSFVLACFVFVLEAISGAFMIVECFYRRGTNWDAKEKQMAFEGP